MLANLRIDAFISIKKIENFLTPSRPLTSH